MTRNVEDSAERRNEEVVFLLGESLASQEQNANKATAAGNAAENEPKVIKPNGHDYREKNRERIKTDKSWAYTTQSDSQLRPPTPQFDGHPQLITK